MASNASTRLNALNSGNNVQSETVDKDMADRIVGAIKGGKNPGALPGVPHVETLPALLGGF